MPYVSQITFKVKFYRVCLELKIKKMINYFLKRSKKVEGFLLADKVCQIIALGAKFVFFL